MKPKAKNNIEADEFLEHLNKQKKNQDEPAWLAEWRQKAQFELKEKGFPTQKVEEYRFTNIRPIIKRSYAFAKRREVSKKILSFYHMEGANLIVLVNGTFSRELSHFSNVDSKIKICSMKEMIANDPDALHDYLQERVFGEDTFNKLNGILFDDGVFIKIRSNAVCKKPIQILHIVDTEETDTIHVPKHMIIAGENAQAQIIEGYVSEMEGCYFTSPSTGIHLATGAKLKYYRLETEGPAAYHTGCTRIWQEKDSQCQAFSITLGSKISRHDLRVKLAGQGAQCDLYGLYALTGESHADHYTHVDHLVPRARSRQVYKGILDDRAVGVFDGKIFVHKGAQETSSSQMNKNLLLSPQAQVHTQPRLEIYADDVKCAHGATVGQLNEDDLFYMQSRAISREDAIIMLCHGFIDELVENITDETVLGYVRKVLAKRFCLSRDYYA